MIFTLKTILVPPLVASRYTCGTRSTAPITIIWLASIVTVFFGLNGGPTGLDSICWKTLGAGAGLWLIAGLWTVMVTRNLAACRPVKSKAQQNDE